MKSCFVASMQTIAVAACLLLAGQAPAQNTRPQPSQRVQPSPPAVQAQPAKAPQQGLVDPNMVGGWAGQVIQLIDRGQLAQVWDGASPVAKKNVKRENFIAGVQAARKPLGAVAGREWTAVRRQRNPGSEGVPAGEYASVELVTLFAGNQVKSEMVTFRHDEDGTWRFTGYVVR